MSGSEVFREISTNARLRRVLRADRRLIEFAGAVGAAIFMSLVLHKRGVSMAAGLLLVPAAAAYLMRRTGNGLLLAAGLIVAVPYWYSLGSDKATVTRVAVVVGIAGLAVGAARWRWTLADVG